MRAIRQKIERGLLFAALACYLSFPISVAAQTFSAGTGFFIAPDGYVATCYHVIANSGEIKIRDSLGQTYPGTVVFTDVANDLAVIKADIGNHSVLPVRRSTEVRKGDAVFTVGYPNIDMQGTDAKVTEGIISSIAGIRGEPNSFQISVAVQPGNSGGPLIDSTGSVIGIVSAKLAQMNALKTSGALPENVNYAVKSNYLLELLATAPTLGGKLVGVPQKAVPEKLSSMVARVERATVLVIAKEAGGRASPSAPPTATIPRNQYEFPKNLSPGTACTDSAQCAGSYPCIGSPPMCQLPFREGHSCRNSHECAGSLSCNAEQCTSSSGPSTAAAPRNQYSSGQNFPPGSACAADLQCVGNNYCIGSPPSCLPRFDVGHACSRLTDCAGNLTCDAGRCTPYVPSTTAAPRNQYSSGQNFPPGSACTTSAQCRDFGYYCIGSPPRCVKP